MHTAIADTPASLRERVVQLLRADILSGRSGPGTMHSVPTLAAELEISTTPVREALLDLAGNGLVTPIRNRGFRVDAMTGAQLDHLFELRELLERHALVSLAKRGLGETAALRALADTVAAAVEAEDGHGYLEADRAFHQALVERAGNPLLTKTVMDLRDRMRLYGFDTPAGRRRQLASVGEHYRLIDLAAAGDQAGIAALITPHIMEWKEVFAAGLATTTGKRLRNPNQLRRSPAPLASADPP